MKLAAIAPGVIRMFFAGSGEEALTEYSPERLEMSFSEPRIAPYVIFVDSLSGLLVLQSESFCKSSMDMDAAHVSAILNLAVIS